MSPLPCSFAATIQSTASVPSAGLRSQRTSLHAYAMVAEVLARPGPRRTLSPVGSIRASEGFCRLVSFSYSRDAAACNCKKAERRGLPTSLSGARPVYGGKINRRRPFLVRFSHLYLRRGAKQDFVRRRVGDCCIACPRLFASSVGPPYCYRSSSDRLASIITISSSCTRAHGLLVATEQTSKWAQGSNSWAHALPHVSGVRSQQEANLTIALVQAQRVRVYSRQSASAHRIAAK